MKTLSYSLRIRLNSDTVIYGYLTHVSTRQTYPVRVKRGAYEQFFQYSMEHKGVNPFSDFLRTVIQVILQW